jgi:hypothetical protein
VGAEPGDVDVDTAITISEPVKPEKMIGTP